MNEIVEFEAVHIFKMNQLKNSWHEKENIVDLWVMKIFRITLNQEFPRAL